jgi:hypothetical protein
VGVAFVSRNQSHLLASTDIGHASASVTTYQLTVLQMTKDEPTSGVNCVGRPFETTPI